MLAGGQSLVPLLNMRFARPAVLVDVNRVPGLDGIAAENGDAPDRGARAPERVRRLTARRASACRSPLAACRYIGHFVTRNRGTVGGSIAHADARAELPLALVALGGSAVRRLARAVAARSRRTTSSSPTSRRSLEPDELLVETLWPAAEPGLGLRLRGARPARRRLRARHDRVRAARRAGADRGPASPSAPSIDRPTVITEAGRSSSGEAVDAALAREAGQAAARSGRPGGLASTPPPAYQRHLTGLLVERAVLGAWRGRDGR